MVTRRLPVLTIEADDLEAPSAVANSCKLISSAICRNVFNLRPPSHDLATGNHPESSESLQIVMTQYDSL